MSFGIQTQTTVTLSDVTLFSAEAEEIPGQEECETSSSETQGHLKTSSKNYTFTQKEVTSFSKGPLTDARSFTFKGEMASKSTFVETSPLMAMSAAYRPAAQQTKVFQKSATKEQLPDLKAMQSISKTGNQEEPIAKNSFKQASHSTSTSRVASQTKEKTHISRDVKLSEPSLEKTEQQHEKAQPLATRQWVKEETKEWWETRYHQRERQGGHQGQEQEQHQEKEEKKFRISKSAGVASKNPSSNQTAKENTQGKIKKPELTPPKIGVFALYFILTKMGILSDGTSNFSYKKEIECVDAETTETHKKRLDEIKEAIKKEKEAARWGVAVKVFSWIASFFGIIAGIALIATGIGAVAGAMMIAGGVIQIASQVMELSGGWSKVADMLPGEDSEKKRAVISWMQIGIAVLCLILSGVGIVCGGFSNFGEAMQMAMGVLGGIASMGYGATTIGEGVTGFFYKNRMAEIKRFDLRLAQLRHMRKDLMEKVEWGVDRLEQLFEDLARSLEFEEELFQADQLVNNR